jgi:UDPglucose 6-dehydrogenase
MTESAPVIGFVGMTHLGLVSGVAATEKGFRVICFDPDPVCIALLWAGTLPVSEPQLEDLAAMNRNRLTFTSDRTDLTHCDVIYVAPDIPTDDRGRSDLSSINELLDLTFGASRDDAVVVVLSQVPPGFTREKQRPGRILYYQVETLIFGCAVERALLPERYIIGCADPGQPLPNAFRRFLEAHGCPILCMRYESAELAKISINMCLVASVTTANTLAELCEKIGADWSEIVPALKLDRRIGQYSYLAPGLGISGGNLERDLSTICNLANQYATDGGVVQAWIANSHHRKDWAASTLREVLLRDRPDPLVAVWGLAYKENTHSTKNSPSLAAIARLTDVRLKVYDPIVSWNDAWHPRAEVAASAIEALDGADALLVLTPWPEFKSIDLQQIAQRMKGRLVLDPYALLLPNRGTWLGIHLHTLGRPPATV